MKGKRQILFAVLAAGIVLFIILLKRESTQPKDTSEGMAAPDFEVSDPVSGKKLSLNQLKGKVVLLNFWASWCAPCKEEMPAIEALYREMSGRQDFVMVTVLYNDSIENGAGLMKSSGLTFPVYTDSDNRSAQAYGVTGVPETFLITKQGRLKKRVIGPLDWNSPEARSYITAMLNE